MKGGKPAIRGGVEWTGLAILFASYGKVAMKSDDNADKEASQEPAVSDWGLVSEKSSETAVEITEKTYDNKWILIKPGKYPEDKEVPLSDYAKL